MSLAPNAKPVIAHNGVMLSRHTRVTRRSAALLLVVALAITSPLIVVAQEYVPAQSRSKAAFLATFPNFVDWPDGAFSAPNSPLVACVLGDFRFGTTLAEVSRDSTPHGRRISVRWIKHDEQIHGCHILFVSSSELSRYSKVVALVQGTNTFTVGETANFLSAGGMLSVSFENEAVQFEVNLGSARAAHFHVSSRLLALAHRVVDPVESTKN
ncbi:MAG TPA: YfiR family protein [Candidatus Acidoferrum sp.]